MTQALASLKVTKSVFEINHGHIIAVHKHCLRAYYDAFDTAVVVVREEFEDIAMRYRKAMLSIYNEFPESAKLRNEIYDLADIKKLESEDFLEETVQTTEQRDAYYLLLGEKLKSVFELYKQKTVMEDHLVVKISQQKVEREKEKRNNIILVIGIIIAVVALFATVLSVAFDSDLKRFGVAFKEYIGINANAGEASKSTDQKLSQ